MAVLDWIFEGVVGWVSSITSDLLDSVSGLFLDALGTDMTTMEEYFPFISKAYSVMQYTGWAILFLIVAWQLFRALGGPITESENPWQLILRGGMFAFLIRYAQPIFLLCLDIARAPYTAMLDLPMEGEDFTFAGIEQALANGMETVAEAATVVGTILILIMLISLGWNYFKLLLEAVERYVVVGVLCYTSPLAFSMGGSKATGNVMKSWCRMVGSQLLMLVMNVWFLRGFTSSVGQFVGSGGALSNGGGGIFLWTFCALAFLKSAQRFDSYLASLGLSVAQTGSSMAMEMMMSAKALSGLGSNVKSAGSLFGAASGAAGAAGVAAGFVSRFSPNSYVRDAVVNGGSKMGFGGGAGFVARTFGAMAARNGAELNTSSIASVANRSADDAGMIGGSIADRSLKNFMPQMKGMKLQDTQISGGHISTTATGKDGKKSNVDLYSAFQYEKPGGAHSVVTASDGSKWYQVASGAGKGAFYDAPNFNGSTPASGPNADSGDSGQPNGVRAEPPSGQADPVSGVGADTAPAADSVDAAVPEGNDPGSVADAATPASLTDPPGNGSDDTTAMPAGTEIPMPEHGTISEGMDSGVDAVVGAEPPAGVSGEVPDSGEIPSGDALPGVAGAATTSAPEPGETMGVVSANPVSAVPNAEGGAVPDAGVPEMADQADASVPAVDVPGNDPAAVATQAEPLSAGDLLAQQIAADLALALGETPDEALSNTGSVPEMQMGSVDVPAPEPVPVTSSSTTAEPIPGNPADVSSPVCAEAGMEEPVHFPERNIPVGAVPLAAAGIAAVAATTLASGDSPAPLPEHGGNGEAMKPNHTDTPVSAPPVPEASPGAVSDPTPLHAVEVPGAAADPVGAEPASDPVRVDNAGMVTQPAFYAPASEPAQIASMDAVPSDAPVRTSDSYAEVPDTDSPVGFHGTDYGDTQPNHGYADLAAHRALVSSVFPGTPGGTMLRTVDEGMIQATSPSGNAMWYNSAYFQEPGAPHEVIQASNGVSWYAMQPQAQAPAFEMGDAAASYNQALFRDFLPGYAEQPAQFDGSKASQGQFEVRHMDGSGTAFFDTARYAAPRGDYQVFEDRRGGSWYALRGEPAIERRPVYENGKPVYDGEKLRTVQVETVRYKQLPTRHNPPQKRKEEPRKPPRRKR